MRRKYRRQQSQMYPCHSRKLVAGPQMQMTVEPSGGITMIPANKAQPEYRVSRV
jgi:hypothetical protein